MDQFCLMVLADVREGGYMKAPDGTGTRTGEGRTGGEERGYNGFPSAKKRSKAERGMKVEKGGTQALHSLSTHRELLCFEGDKRRERGITYLAWFPPPSSSVGSSSSSLLYLSPSGN